MKTSLLIAAPNEFRYSERFIHYHLERLHPVATLHEGFNPVKEMNGKTIYPFPFNLLIVRGTLRNLFSSLYQKIYSHYFRRYLNHKNINVVLAEYGPMGAMLATPCSLSDIPMVVHFHGFDAADRKILKQYETPYQKMFKKAYAIVVVSEDMKQVLLSLGCAPEKLKLIPYGVDLSLFEGANPAKNELVYIAVGRLTYKKSPLNTIKAFKGVHEMYPDAKLVFIGDGELQEECVQLVKEYSLGNAVTFKGVMTHANIIQELKKARCFVQHSVVAPSGDSEGTPNTILEAQASGLPVVSTRHAGIKQAVVHDQTGFLVEEGDVEGMKEYMLRFAKDETLAGTMGKHARLHVQKNYNIDIQMNLLGELLNSSLKK